MLALSAVPPPTYRLHDAITGPHLQPATRPTFRDRDAIRVDGCGDAVSRWSKPWSGQQARQVLFGDAKVLPGAQSGRPITSNGPMARGMLYMRTGTPGGRCRVDGPGPRACVSSTRPRIWSSSPRTLGEDVTVQDASVGPLFRSVFIRRRTTGSSYRGRRDWTATGYIWSARASRRTPPHLNGHWYRFWDDAHM